jgi:hypothetical protein
MQYIKVDELMEYHRWLIEFLTRREYLQLFSSEEQVKRNKIMIKLPYIVVGHIKIDCLYEGKLYVDYCEYTILTILRIFHVLTEDQFRLSAVLGEHINWFTRLRWKFFPSERDQWHRFYLISREFYQNIAEKDITLHEHLTTDIIL